MFIEREDQRAMAIALMMAAVICLNYFALYTLNREHTLDRSLFYLPLVLGTFWFALKGALIISISTLLLYLPCGIQLWKGFSAEDAHMVGEALVYGAITLIFGFQVQRAEKERLALIEAERLSAIGRTVVEVAHDMRAPPWRPSAGSRPRSPKAWTRGIQKNRGKLDIVGKEAARSTICSNSRLTGNQDRTLRGADPVQMLQNPAYRRRIADDLLTVGKRRHLRSVKLGFIFQTILEPGDLLIGVRIVQGLQTRPWDRIGARSGTIWKKSRGLWATTVFSTVPKRITWAVEGGCTPYLLIEGLYNARLEVIRDVPRGTCIYHFEGTDLAKAKEVLDDTVCLMGNMPNSLLATGTVGQVKDHTKMLIDTCGQNGGYIMSAGALIDHARPENVEAWFDTTREYGKYR